MAYAKSRTTTTYHSWGLATLRYFAVGVVSIMAAPRNLLVPAMKELNLCKEESKVLDVYSSLAQESVDKLIEKKVPIFFWRCESQLAALHPMRLCACDQDS